MGAPRLRIGLVAAATAAAVIGGMVAPTGATAAPPAPPTNLQPNSPSSAPSSSTPGTPVKNVVLTWNPVAGATSYQVQVSDANGNFEDEGQVTASVDVTTTLTSFAPSSLLPHADYAWRVRASGGEWSSNAYFTRGWTASPGNPQFVGDPSSSTGPVMTWDGVPDASYYEVQISPRPFVQGDDPTDGGFGTGDEDASSCFTASTQFTPYATPYGDDDGVINGETTTKCVEFGDGGTWYWRVRARDGVFDPAKIKLDAPAYDCLGVWYAQEPSETDVTAECSSWAYPAPGDASFHVDAYTGLNTPAKVTGLDISPRAGANTSPVAVTSTPAFAWTPQANASFYRVYQTRDASSKTGDHEWETTATRLSPVIQEQDRNVRTYWRVQACTVSSTDSDGFVLTYKGDDARSVQCGPASDWMTYVKTTPAETQITTYPQVSGGWKLTWKTAYDFDKPNGGPHVAVTDVEGYRIQISDWYGSFDRPSRTLQVDRQTASTGYSSASIAAAGLPEGFKVRVRGVDSSGNGYPWSEAIEIGNLAPAVGTITTRSGFGRTSPVDFRFNADVQNVTPSTVKLVATSNGAAVRGSIATTSVGRSYRFYPSTPWVAGEYYRLSVTTSVKTVGTNVPARAGSTVVRSSTSVENTDASLRKVKGDYSWVSARASDARNGSYLRSNDKKSTSKKSYVETRVRGRSVAVYACVGPRSGYARISVDGSTQAKVNLHRKASRCDVRVKTVALNASKQHTVRFTAIGKKVKKSKSAEVRFDRIIAG